MSATSSGFFGTIMYLGTRLGGHPIAPVGWRWGFGRDYPAGYDPPVAADGGDLERVQ